MEMRVEVIIASDALTATCIRLGSSVRNGVMVLNRGRMAVPSLPRRLMVIGMMQRLPTVRKFRINGGRCGESSHQNRSCHEGDTYTHDGSELFNQAVQCGQPHFVSVGPPWPDMLYRFTVAFTDRCGEPLLWGLHETVGQLRFRCRTDLTTV